MKNAATFTTPKFRNQQGSSFHQELKKRVNNYFIENKKAATGNWSLYLKPFYFGPCT
jgi:hypothetical protein